MCTDPRTHVCPGTLFDSLARGAPVSGRLESAVSAALVLRRHCEEAGSTCCNASGVAPFFVVVKYFESLPPELPWVALRTAFI